MLIFKIESKEEKIPGECNSLATCEGGSVQINFEDIQKCPGYSSYRELPG